MALLAAERLRSRAPASGTLLTEVGLTGVGLAQQTASELRRTLGPRLRAATRRLDQAYEQSILVGSAGLLEQSSLIERSRSRLAGLLANARRTGAATAAAGRAEAETFLRSNVDEGIGWAQSHVVPQLVDGLVPHLVESVVPRLIEGALPDIRDRVLPVMIDDLAHDPQVRDLVSEQSRGVVDEAAEHVRSATAEADDRVEEAFRRLLRPGESKQANPRPASSTHEATVRPASSAHGPYGGDSHRGHPYGGPPSATG